MSMSVSLLDRLGWSPAWALAFESLAEKAGCVPARVCAQHRDQYQLRMGADVVTAELAGRLRHQAEIADAVLPAVGDWVAAAPYPGESRATLCGVLPRRSAFVRKAAGGGPFEQVVAANVDTALLVSGLDDNFNPRRIERYLTLAYESGALPVVVLNKADLLPRAEDRAAARRAAEAVAPGVPVVFVAAPRNEGGHGGQRGEGIAELRDYLPAGQTAVLLGSSGVGKSTLVNALAGQALLTTGAVSAHQSLGRHTTTHRQLVELPHGGLIIDTPGMRELQLWGDESMLARSFESVEQLFLLCRFSDCQHQTEPGCAVLAALEAGELALERWESYRKQLRELQFLDRKSHKSAASRAKEQWRALNKSRRSAEKQERRMNG